MSREELKAYLAEIIELETKRYDISLAVSELEKKRTIYDEMANRAVSEEYSLQKWTMDTWKDILKSAFIAGLTGIMTGLAGSIIVDDLPGMIPFKMHFFAKVNILGGFVSFFLISFFVLVLHMIVETYTCNEKAIRHNQERESLNSRILEESRYARKRIRILNGEIQQLSEGYRKTDRQLQKMYKENIIYSKYRELFPVSRFYEYISSGRCTQLEGSGGAYNLYENELLAKAILDSMEEAGCEGLIS